MKYWKHWIPFWGLICERHKEYVYDMEIVEYTLWICYQLSSSILVIMTLLLALMNYFN